VAEPQRSRQEEEAGLHRKKGSPLPAAPRLSHSDPDEPPIVDPVLPKDEAKRRSNLQLDPVLQQQPRRSLARIAESKTRAYRMNWLSGFVRNNNDNLWNTRRTAYRDKVTSTASFCDQK